MKWIPIDDQCPKNGQYVLVSFANYPLPTIAEYRRKWDGSYFCSDGGIKFVAYTVLIVKSLLLMYGKVGNISLIIATIASEFAKIDLKHIISKGTEYKLLNDDLNYCVSERPNDLPF